MPPYLNDPIFEQHFQEEIATNIQTFAPISEPKQRWPSMSAQTNNASHSQLLISLHLMDDDDLFIYFSRKISEYGPSEEW